MHSQPNKGLSAQERRRRIASQGRIPDFDDVVVPLHAPEQPYPFGNDDLESLSSPSKHTEPPFRWHSCLTREPLLLFTLIGVALGVILGTALRPAGLSPAAIDAIGFPGELMLRLLKMLVLPLVAASMVSGMCSLRETGSAASVRRLGKLTALYYAGSTLIAIALGLALVLLIQPGRNAAFDKIASSGGGCRAADAATVAAHAASVNDGTAGGAGGGATEALLHVSRLVVPDNVVAAAVDTNVLGVITFSLLFGWALGAAGPIAAPVIAVAHGFNAAVGKMVTAALWLSPLGVGCLIASSILRACDLGATLSALGLWLATVILGLFAFAGLILPAFLLLSTRHSPLRVASHFGQALALAFGTSSSAAALPAAMQGATDAGCDPAVVSFFLPLGIAVNMNGTALYEAITAIFIAQSHSVSLGPAEVVVVAVTASLAAVGAPAIPSAGLVTMLIVLQAVGLDQYSGDLAVILAADWLLDRVRTAVNLLSDGFGCVVVDAAMKGAREEGVGGGGDATAVGNGAGVAYSQVEMGAARRGRTDDDM